MPKKAKSKPAKKKSAKKSAKTEASKTKPAAKHKTSKTKQAASSKGSVEACPPDEVMLHAREVYTLKLHLDPKHPTGPNGKVLPGTRAIFPIPKGTCTGRLRGRIVNPSGDWAEVRAPIEGRAIVELDVRLTCRTNDDAVVYIRVDGIASSKDGNLWEVRSTQMFETGDARYDWLNAICESASAARRGTPSS